MVSKMGCCHVTPAHIHVPASRVMEVVLTLSHGWHQGLHELRASAATLEAVGARSFTWLLLGGRVPCLAAVEAGVKDGCVVVPGWMLRQLHAAPGERTWLERHPDDGTDATLPVASHITLEPAAIAKPKPDVDNSSESDGELNEFDCGEVESVSADATAELRASAYPFDAAATRAMLRQLAGTPMRVGSVCAVQRLYGVCVLRVAALDVESAHIGPLSKVTVRELEPPTSPALPAATEHGAAVVAALCAHGEALLVPRATAKGSDRLAAVALRGGHALLCGPSGNGKLRALKRIASILRGSAGASILRLRSAKLLAAADSGSADQLLDAIFEGAKRRAPSIVLVYQLHLLASDGAEDTTSTAGAASDVAANGGAATQVAAALLARMRAAPRGVIVVASASDPAALPACLRAHGGFEITFNLPAPTLAERRALLASWLPPTLTAEAHAASLARLTASYSLRDLRRVLTATAALAAARGPSPPVWGDVLAALRSSRPSDNAHQSLVAPVSAPADVAWSRVGGYTALCDRLQRLLKLHADYAAAGAGGGGSTLGVLQPPSGALLYGPPGNGKTHLATCLSEASGWPRLSVQGSQLFGAYVGETEAAIRAVFRCARERAPSIIVIDELDALGGQRGGEATGGSTVAQRALSTLLNEMDGIGHAGPSSAAAGGPSGAPVFLLGCTNRPDLVDAALLRPGRLEQLLHVRHPNVQEREDVLRVHSAGLPLAADVALDVLATATDGFSCAALAALCKEAARQALARLMRRGEGEEEGEEDAGTEEEEAANEEDGPADERLRVEREAAAAVEVAQRDLQWAARLVRREQVLPAAAHAQLTNLSYEAFQLYGGAEA